VAVGALTRIACRQRPHLAYLLWLVVLVKSLTPPIWSSPTSIFSWAAARSVVTEMPVHDHPMMLASAQPVIAGSLSPLAIAQPSSSWGIAEFVIIIWAGGCLCVLFTILIRSSYLSRRIAASSIPVPGDLLDMIESLRDSLGIRRRISLTLSSQPIGPAVFGIIRPTLVVPNIILENQNRDRLCALFAHELIHLRRGDPLIAGLQLLIQAIWWFHPLVWWMNSQINHVREMCCDAEAIADTQCPREDYAQMLVDVLRRRRVLQPILPSLGMRSQQVTARRLDQVLKGAGWSHRHVPWRYWLALAFCGLLILPGSGIRFHHDRAAVLADQATSNPTARSTSAENQHETHYVRVVVDVNSVSFQGKPTTLAKLPALLEAVDDSADTVLQMAYATDEVTMGWFMRVESEIYNDDERRKLGFKYLDHIGQRPVDSVGADLRPAAMQRPTPLPSLPQAPVSQLTHNVSFQTGQTQFQGGDSITITEVRGTSDTIQVGGTYQVKGTYHLASHDQATLALSVTAIRPEDAYGDWAAN